MTQVIDAPRPVCFMVMPFRKRPITPPVGPGAPGELDCDQLWDRVYRPAIERLGYLPVRADAETGSVIVKDMLERLAYAALVLADVTLPNGNVYYEIGLRHVAERTGCVLLATSWSKQLFDIDQFRTLRFPLADGSVPQAEADPLVELLVKAVPAMSASVTPWHEFVSGDQRQRREAMFRDQSEAVSRLQSRMGAVRLAPAGARAAMVRSILGDLSQATLRMPEIVIELLVLIRDSVGWADVLAFVETLPDSARSIAFVEEQRLLALAETGKPEEAIAGLETMVATRGDTPERRGLLGGRCKRRWHALRDARKAAGGAEPTPDERGWLDRAIEHYTRGMELDYNEFYCSSNLPTLLQARGDDDDVERAAMVEHFVVAACSRTLALGGNDPWLRQTLLGAAFRARDLARVRELAKAVEREGAPAWMGQSTLADLRRAVEQAEGDPNHAQLAAVLGRLEMRARG